MHDVSSRVDGKVAEVPVSVYVATRNEEYLWNAAYLALKPVTIAFYTFSQVLVALRLFDIINIRQRRLLFSPP